MVLAKSKHSVGLGNSLMSNRFGNGRGSDRRKVSADVVRTGPNNEMYITNEPKEASWVKMRSVTEQTDLDEFLTTAELADTNFTAEKVNRMKVYHTDQFNPYLLRPDDERRAAKRQKANQERLTVPRRPAWDQTTTPRQLDAMEKKVLLDWRRGLAELQESSDLLMTPFERNLEVWRQLWRVIERSDLIVQIVDARNPLLFRCEDLERYVKEVGKAKANLLLVNKADLLSQSQRLTWANYFKNAGIAYQFFSASLAAQADLETKQSAADTPDAKDDNAAERSPTADSESEARSESGEERPGLDSDTASTEGHGRVERFTNEVVAREGSAINASRHLEDDGDGTRILTVDELEGLFIRHAPEQGDGNEQGTTVGLVGYPNVGKSSTINALLGAKKVSVSSTPGKTKHFQTIRLSPQIMLCDCPGLVLPNFTFTKAELVCSGVLPIDQQREYTGPAALVAQRIPQRVLERVYGIKIETHPIEDGGTGTPTSAELLTAYAKARGFATTNKGNPDQSRAARLILKDFVKGKLLFCNPPPTESPIDPLRFNDDLFSEPGIAWMSCSVPSGRDGEAEEARTSHGKHGQQPRVSAKSLQLDKQFFQNENRHAGHLRQPAHLRVTPSGKVLSGRKEKELVAAQQGIRTSELAGDKKHFKRTKRLSGTSSNV